MTKKKMNPAAMLGLQKWRDSLPKDKNGKTIYPPRKSNEALLKDKKEKLEKLEKAVREMRIEIAKLDKSVNKKNISKLVEGYTYEELARLLAH